MAFVTCLITLSFAAIYPGFINMITDPSLVFTIPQIPMPAYLTPFTYPTFGTTVTRIGGVTNNSFSWPAFNAAHPAGSGTWGSDARHHYSKDEPWNSDSSLIAIQNSGSPSVVYLDGANYTVKFGQCSNYSVGDDRWHPNPQHPNERINANGSTLEWFDVVNCQRTRSWTLPFSAGGLGHGEGNMSINGRYVALDNGTYMAIIDMDPQPPFASYASGNRRIGPTYNYIADCGLSGGCSVDWVSISASGKYAVVSYNGDYPRVFDVDPNTLALTPHALPTGSPECKSDHNPALGFIYDLGHADMTLNPYDNNEDVIVGQARSWCPPTGSVVMVRLRDDTVTSLTNPTNEATDHHVSTRNQDRLGWAYAGYYETAGTRFNNEIIAVSLNSTASNQIVQRFVHEHSNESTYRGEPHAVPSRDGRRVIWASNWMTDCDSGCGTSTSEVKDYVVDARNPSAPAPPTNLQVK